jgi:hypothetical protein
VPHPSMPPPPRPSDLAKFSLRELLVACLPVVVLGCGAALAHLLHTGEET